jgi:hypothetical protein
MMVIIAGDLPLASDERGLHQQRCRRRFVLLFNDQVGFDLEVPGIRGSFAHAWR